MVALNQFKQNTTASRIEDKTVFSELRPYLGMSQIGHSCERFLWYSFRWCFDSEISARVNRLFSRGHKEEQNFIDELESVGVRCYGDQTEINMAFGHSKGHCDGIAIGVIEAPKTEHLLEFKTMSDKYFKDIVKNGLKNSKPIYYAQVQIYMRKLNLSRCLFGAVNKNDDSLYWERLKLDEGYADDIERKAERIILSETPPKKKFSPVWYECKWCQAAEICHNGGSIKKTCRTCKFVDILNNGEWSCRKYDDLKLCSDQQKIACKHYELMEMEEE